MTLRTVARSAAAALVVAAAGGLLPASPAAAAACAGSDGVSVVVDFHELGGGVRTACVSDGAGKTAATVFPAAGFSLDYVQRQPGMVCRVSGAPADAACVNSPPANAYWSLWWSDGDSGTWTYATLGVGGLKVPDGGYLAFSWNGSSGRVEPGFAPAPHVDHPSPSTSSRPTKTPKPTHSAGTGTTSSSAAASGSASSAAASATPSESPTESASSKGPGRQQSDSASAAASATAAASPDASTDSDTSPVSSEAAEPDDGGLPGWVGPVVVVALLAAGGAAAVVRRRRSTP